MLKSEIRKVRELEMFVTDKKLLNGPKVLLPRLNQEELMNLKKREDVGYESTDESEYNEDSDVFDSQNENLELGQHRICVGCGGQLKKRVVCWSCCQWY